MRVIQRSTLIEQSAARMCALIIDIGSSFAAAVFEPLFEETAASLVDAFAGRARDLAVVRP